MKTSIPLKPLKFSQRGYALLVVMVFLGLAVLLLAGAMNWTSQNVRNIDRGNEYYTSSAAAEAATEKLFVHISRDYLQNGESGTYNNITNYVQSSYSPGITEGSYWTNYSYSQPTTSTSGSYVGRKTTNQYVVLDGQYTGLFGYRAIYRIAATATASNGRYRIPATVAQDIGLESIPLFQFAIFYNMDLEMEPSPAMVVSGRVHSNSNIYLMPSTSLTFSNDVTASGLIYNTNMPGDTHLGFGGLNTNIHFLGAHTGTNSTLNLPIGTNNTPNAVHQVLEVPPPGEDPNSALGTNRFFNKADLTILITNGLVAVTSGVTLAGSQITLSNQWTNFLTTNVTFYDKRENSTILTAQFDVAKFKSWAENATNGLKTKLIGKTTANIVYINDSRSTNLYSYVTNGITHLITTNVTTVELGVRVINGTNLPSSGLTIATPNPLYVLGNFNTTTDNVHFSVSTNDTTYTRPASLLADAITVLSPAWNDANSSLTNTSRVATNDTVNAAFLAGIVPTSTNGTGYYSGGVENFPRFLENWNVGTQKTFWYNGSMVVLFDSKYATDYWNNNGDIYQPPVRNWAFDKNFYQEAKLPPGTPQILFIERLHWAMLAPNTVPSSLGTNYGVDW